mgnify:FL=1
MKIGEAWEKRDWGGPKPIWRVAPPTMTRGSPLARTIRTATNRRAKKLRLVFRGDSLKAY